MCYTWYNGVHMCTCVCVILKGVLDPEKVEIKFASLKDIPSHLLEDIAKCYTQVSNSTYIHMYIYIYLHVHIYIHIYINNTYIPVATNFCQSKMLQFFSCLN